MVPPVHKTVDHIITNASYMQGGEGADANGTSPTVAADKDMALDDATLLDR
jgi:hypothetical protein